MSEVTVAKNGGGEEQKRCKLRRDQIGSLFNELIYILHWQRQRNVGPPKIFFGYIDKEDIMVAYMQQQ